MCLALATAACVGATDEESLDDTQDELRVSDVMTFEIRKMAGFGPESINGKCRSAGRWSVDLVGRKLQGQGCVNAVSVTVDRGITTEEVGQIRKALFKVKTAKRPERCPSDLSITPLDVFRETREDHYVEQRAACGPAIPVTSESVGELLDVVTTLASPPAAAE